LLYREYLLEHVNKLYTTFETMPIYILIGTIMKLPCSLYGWHFSQLTRKCGYIWHRNSILLWHCRQLSRSQFIWILWCTANCQHICILRNAVYQTVSLTTWRLLQLCCSLLKRTS